MENCRILVLSSFVLFCTLSMFSQSETSATAEHDHGGKVRIHEKQARPDSAVAEYPERLTLAGVDLKLGMPEKNTLELLSKAGLDLRPDPGYQVDTDAHPYVVLYPLHCSTPPCPVPPPGQSAYQGIIAFKNGKLVYINHSWSTGYPNTTFSLGEALYRALTLAEKDGRSECTIRTYEHSLKDYGQFKYVELRCKPGNSRIIVSISHPTNAPEVAFIDEILRTNWRPDPVSSKKDN